MCHNDDLFEAVGREIQPLFSFQNMGTLKYAFLGKAGFSVNNSSIICPLSICSFIDPCHSLYSLPVCLCRLVAISKMGDHHGGTYK